MKYFKIFHLTKKSKNSSQWVLLKLMLILFQPDEVKKVIKISLSFINLLGGQDIKFIERDYLRSY